MTKLLHVDGVTRRYGSLEALKPTSFDLIEGELLAFVGPSGAGKTSLLKILAGIESPDEGNIYTDKPFNRDHPAILVFQDYMLFPHLSVFENVAFGLRSRRRACRMGRAEIRERVLRYLEQLDIRDKAERRPEELSGGQKQRVALARALVMEPRLLLLDEPFANLDRALKHSTARFVRKLQKELRVTMVVVSHDLEETVEVADRIGVIVGGELRQIGTFRDVYTRPESLAVAELFGPVNVIPSNISDMLLCKHVDVLTFSRHGTTMVCRPESLLVTSSPNGPARIVDFRLRAGKIQYEVELDGWRALASSETDAFSIGERVSLTVGNVIEIPTL